MFHFDHAKTKLRSLLRVRVLVAILLSGVCAASVFAVAARTRLVTVVDGENTVTMMTMQTDNDQILKQAGVELEKNDRVLETAAEGNVLTLEVDRAIEVSVAADGETKNVVLYEGCVADALAAAGVTAGAEDICSLSLGLKLADGMSITLDRVEYREVTETEEIPYEEERRDDKTLLKGKTKIYQYGIPGERTIVTREKLINGEVVSTEVISDEVTKEPLNKIVLVGTKKPVQKVVVAKQTSTATNSGTVGSAAVPASASWRAKVNSDGTLIDHEGNPVSYQGMLSGRATAYYAAPGAGTSTGRKAQYGVVAVNPKVIPYGTKLYICSADGSIVYGYAVAGDTGGTLMAGTVLVDLYYNNYQQCCWFGSRKMNVYVLS